MFDLPPNPQIPKIAPVPEGIERPFWSVMIPTYNCTHYLQHTLNSILAQEPGSDLMQIEVVDDCSTQDDPQAVVQEVGKGRVDFYRNPHNIGPQANFNRCLERAKGHWVHILHGDDLVKCGFYQRLQQIAEENTNLGAVFCRHINIDDQGNIKGLGTLEQEISSIIENCLESFTINHRVRTPSMIVKRSVYEKLGGFHLGLCHTADREMWIRIAAHYPIWYETEPLAYYRQHLDSDTNRLARSGQNIADTRKCIEICKNYLPASKAKQWSAQAQEKIANRAMYLARVFWQKGEYEYATNQMRESLLCSQSNSTEFNINYQKILQEYLYKASHIIQELQQKSDWLEQEYKNHEEWIEEIKKGKDWLEGELKASIIYAQSLEKELELIKKSKFWKLHTLWQKIQQTLGLSH